eukprot:1485884-Rhodomonas_salina.1
MQTLGLGLTAKGKDRFGARSLRGAVWLCWGGQASQRAWHQTLCQDRACRSAHGESLGTGTLLALLIGKREKLALPHAGFGSAWLLVLDMLESVCQDRTPWMSVQSTSLPEPVSQYRKWVFSVLEIAYASTQDMVSVCQYREWGQENTLSVGLSPTGCGRSTDAQLVAS